MKRRTLQRMTRKPNTVFVSPTLDIHAHHAPARLLCCFRVNAVSELSRQDTRWGMVKEARIRLARCWRFHRRIPVRDPTEVYINPVRACFLFLFQLTAVTRLKHVRCCSSCVNFIYRSILLLVTVDGSGYAQELRYATFHVCVDYPFVLYIDLWSY